MPQYPEQQKTQNKNYQVAENITDTGRQIKNPLDCNCQPIGVVDRNNISHNQPQESGYAFKKTFFIAYGNGDYYYDGYEKIDPVQFPLPAKLILSQFI
jgi:hypothetical protein